MRYEISALNVAKNHIIWQSGIAGLPIRSVRSFGNPTLEVNLTRRYKLLILYFFKYNTIQTTFPNPELGSQPFGL